MKNILIVNPFGIGDVLFTTPLIPLLKEKYPSAAISYLGNARTELFLRNDPRLEKVLVYERDDFVAVYKRSPWQFLLKWRQLVSEIRSGSYDVAFDLSLGGPVSLALLWAGVPRRIGFDYKGRGRWLTDRVPLKGFEERHVVDYNLDLLRRLDETAVKAGQGMSFFPSKADEAWAEDFLRTNGIKPAAVIGLYPGGGASWGAAAAVRRWPLENYVKLADKIVEKAHLAIILMGDKADVSLCDTVATRASGHLIMAAGKATLGQSAALMKRCRFMLLNDGGAMHVAAAMDVRTAVIFGPVDPRVYGPYPPERHRTVTKGLPCQPCYRNFRMSDCKHQACLKQLAVEDVFQSIEEWL